MTDNNELPPLVREIDLVLTDPDTSLSDGASRSLQFIRAALAQRQGEPVYAYTEQQIADACVTAEIPDSKCQSLLIALQEAGTAPATAEQPAEPLFVFEHDDGRYAVGPEGAAFTVGEPAWHRLGVVSLLVAAPVAEALTDSQRLDWCQRSLVSVCQDAAELFCITYLDNNGDRTTGRFTTLRDAIDAAVSADLASTKKDEQA